MENGTRVIQSIHVLNTLYVFQTIITIIIIIIMNKHDRYVMLRKDFLNFQFPYSQIFKLRNWETKLNIPNACLCVYVRVYVRQRDRERKIKPLLSKSLINILLFSVVSLL